MVNSVKTVLHKTISFLSSPLKAPSQPRACIKNAKEIHCSRDFLKYASSSSGVFHIQTPDIDGYFFECRQHQPILDYVKSFVEDYYSLVFTESPYNEIDKALVLTSIQNSDNFKKFISMGIYFYNADTPCMDFLRTGNGKAIGLDINENDTAQTERLQKFVREYAWCQLDSYYLNKCLKHSDLQTKNTNSALASQKVAELLNINYMLPKAEYTYLKIDNHNAKFGLFVETSEGCSILPYSSDERKAKLTPSLQRDLMQLNILDVINYEQDHSPNNYNVIMDEQGYVTGISPFDNKSAGAFPLNGRIDFTTYKNCSPIIDKNGLINRPYLNKSIIEHIEALTIKDLFSSLKEFLRPIQIIFTWKRVMLLKKAIRKTIKENKNFIINDNDWSELTMKQELNGNYGKTYLISFYSDVFLYL